MKDIDYELPDEVGPIERPERDAIWLDYGFIGADATRVGDTAAREFRAANPNITWTFKIAALENAAKAHEACLKKLIAQYYATDAFDTVISTEQVAKPHWAIRLSGLAIGAIGIGLMIPVPLVIGFGIHESLLIEKTVEFPWLATLYGFAPMAAPLAAHGLRDALKTDQSRRVFDLAVYTSTLVAFGAWAWAWAWSFGPTFLVDVLADPSAAANAGSLAEFYGFQLLLEVSAAASAYCAAMHLLTTGAKRVSAPSQARKLLAEAIEAEIQTGEEIAHKRDLLNVTSDSYGAAQSAYQDHALLKTEVAAKLFAAQSSRDSVEMLTELRAALIPQTTGASNV